MKTEEGITLIELVVTISIIVILVVALGFSFQGWMGGYNVEGQMKNMYFDLMNARARSMERNRMHFVSLTTTQYTIQEDICPWPDGDGNLSSCDSTRPSGYTDPIPWLQKKLDSRYPITWSNSGDPAPQIQFSKKGFSNGTRYICCNTTANADYNCIEITESRINIGKLTTKIPDGGACNATNCISK